jgi:hypothetical protein
MTKWSSVTSIVPAAMAATRSHHRFPDASVAGDEGPS